MITTLTFRDRLAHLATQLRTQTDDPEAEAWATLIDGLLAGSGADRLEADMIAEGLDPLGAETRGYLGVPMA
jgi:hypothetical protein